ncbi:uncharacterized protein LOC105156002 [Sesamum indicum]|uniref:Uncharacterized protein LOC105156002 n=1 Tax=Sesamum indicum TaxID=4182 RepID=A0A6I9SMH6_SESIN|nr:uncharacterized protein LOC105156002 [Sesamum indicum]
MQRQSLGSPSSKLVQDERQTQKQFPSSSSSSSSSSSHLSTINGEDYCKVEEEELKKMMRLKPPHTYIHIIPMLTLLCFLILYLSSHDPSPNDLAEFNTLKTFPNRAESEDNISELKGIMEIRKGDVLALRSLKNSAAKHRRLHRKIPRF